MRNYVILTLIACLHFGTAQEAIETANGSNEIKFNLAYTLLSVPEVTYERILSQESALGFSLAFALEEDIDYQFGLTPYYRFYFGEKKARGFFVEANSSIYSVRRYETNFFGDALQENERKETFFGLGAAVGGKFLNNKGWVGEAYAGFGRNLNGSGDADWGYPRFGFVLGKRL